MKLSTLLTVICLSLFAMSCNVTESIVFNEDMSGSYKMIYDLSPMMNYANASKPEGEAREAKEVLDTIFDMDQIMVQYKDSIAKMSPEERYKLEQLKGLSIEIHQDEANGISNYGISKKFENFEALKSVGKNLDNATNMIFDYGSNDTAGANEMKDFKKEEKILYSFKDNVFERINYKPIDEELNGLEEPLEVEETLEEDDSIITEEVVVEDYPIESVDLNEEDSYEESSTNASADDKINQMEVQFEEAFANSFYTMQYTFPKRIKSVSNDKAVISKDGKSMTLKIDWDSIHKNDDLVNIKVILED
ncbi:MAG: hypothetical protein R2783_06420 [Gelidibacter sp.]